jgi:hypothetical protein
MATENYLNGAALQLPFFGEPYGIGTVKRRRNPSINHRTSLHCGRAESSAKECPMNVNLRLKSESRLFTNSTSTVRSPSADITPTGTSPLPCTLDYQQEEPFEVHRAHKLTPIYSSA